MTSPTSEKPVARRTETGWSKTRRRLGKGVVRTCVPAVLDEGVARTAESRQEGNIVRGED